MPTPPSVPTSSSLTGLTRQQFKDRLNELVTISQTNPRPSWWPTSGETGWPLPYALEDTWYIIDLARRGWSMTLGPLLLPPSIDFLEEAWAALKNWLSSLPGSATDADDIADQIEAWCAQSELSAWET